MFEEKFILISLNNVSSILFKNMLSNLAEGNVSPKYRHWVPLHQPVYRMLMEQSQG
jgi:hypothetical protein